MSRIAPYQVLGKKMGSTSKKIAKDSGKVMKEE